MAFILRTPFVPINLAGNALWAVADTVDYVVYNYHEPIPVRVVWAPFHLVGDAIEGIGDSLVWWVEGSSNTPKSGNAPWWRSPR
jgi:hypothetical protein